MKGKMTILAVFAVFLAPVIIAVLLHSQWFEWRPADTRNYGELTEPPQPLPAFQLTDADGRPVSRKDLIGHWQLLHYTAGACGSDCVETLYWLRQVRRAQDRHQPEIALILVTPRELAAPVRAEIDALEADVLILTGATGQAFARYLPDTGESSVSYILDPGANIILRYSSEPDFNGMRRDLRRLLTWTRPDPQTPDPSAQMQ